jgi:hypothetical protein
MGRIPDTDPRTLREGGNLLAIGPRMKQSLPAVRTELLERDRELERLQFVLRHAPRRCKPACVAGEARSDLEETQSPK